MDTSYNKAMQFRVPQNIAMEDRIVGPLNPMQFTIMVVGGGIAFFVLKSTTIPSVLAKGGGLTLAFITLLLAVGKFNDQPLYRFFRFIIAFIFSPKTRIWHKAGMQPLLVKPAPKVESQKDKKASKHVSKADIVNLARVLDTQGKEGIVPQQQSSTDKP